MNDERADLAAAEKVAAAKAAARAGAWKWRDGEELEFYKVSYSLGNRLFEHWTLLDEPVGGYHYVIEATGERELRIVCPMLWERFVAKSVEDLPVAWRDAVMVEVADVELVDGEFAFAAPGRISQVWTGMWEPIPMIRQVFDAEEGEAQDFAADSAMACLLAMERMFAASGDDAP